MSKQQLLDHRVLGLPAHPASAGLARRLIEEVLEDVVPGEVLENAQLLVSEVVTNAIVHARSDIGLTVSLVREFVRVEVADHSPHLPVLKQCDDDSVTGYGLDLVARLAADCGVVTHEAGKAVWFTLRPACRPLTQPRHTHRGDGQLRGTSARRCSRAAAGSARCRRRNGGRDAAGGAGRVVLHLA